MSDGIVYTGKLSHSKFYVSWQQAGDKSRIINWQAGIVTKDESGYYDNWYTNAITINSIVIDGKNVLSNGVYSYVSGGSTVQLASGTVEVGGSSFSISIRGSLYNTGTADGNQTCNIDLEPPKPVVSIREISHSATKIRIECTDINGVNSEIYHVYDGPYFLKEANTKDITIYGLIPSKLYNVKAFGRANGSFGGESNILHITTSPRATITNIDKLDTNGASITISNQSGEECNLVIMINNEEFARRNNIVDKIYNFNFTEEEKIKLYKLIGTKKGLDCVIRIENADGYNDYARNITLASDVFSCTVIVDGVPKKGRVWVGTADGNKRGVFVVGTKNGNRRGA